MLVSSDAYRVSLLLETVGHHATTEKGVGLRTAGVLLRRQTGRPPFTFGRNIIQTGTQSFRLAHAKAAHLTH